MRLPKPTWVDLHQLLERYPDTLHEVDETILILQTLYPCYPGPHINFPDGPWPREKPYFVKKSHLISNSENFHMAATNITKTGRILTSSDETYLQYILAHWFGWSATAPSHHNDSWVQYIKHQYSHIENLCPVLDSMTWPEEVEHYPSGLGPGHPGNFLLATKTAFYYYHYDPDYLMRAGTTLEEVYWGLREDKWRFEKQDRWHMESDNGEEYDVTDYFPIWCSRYRDGQMSSTLAFPIVPFIPYSEISKNSAGRKDNTEKDVNFEDK
jgi:hypothetical protein